MFILFFFINICCFINHNTYNILDFYFILFFHFTSIHTVFMSIISYFLKYIYISVCEKRIFWYETSDCDLIWEIFQWWFIYSSLLIFSTCKPFQVSHFERIFWSCVETQSKQNCRNEKIIGSVEPWTNNFQLFYRRKIHKVLWLVIFLSFNTLSIEND